MTCQYVTVSARSIPIYSPISNVIRLDNIYILTKMPINTLCMVIHEGQFDIVGLSISLYNNYM